MRKTGKISCALASMLVMMILFSMTGLACAADFSKADLKRMSTFLSNFTELGLRTFDVDYGGAPDVIHLRDPNQIGRLIFFGVWHNFINNFDSRIEDSDYSYGGCAIKGKFVSESVKKYFDLDIKHQSVTDPMKLHYDSKKCMYHFSGASGEYTLYADVQKATKNKNGSITMTGELYNAEDKTDRPMTFTALAKPYKWAGKNTWSILSMTSTKKGAAPAPNSGYTTPKSISKQSAEDLQSAIWNEGFFDLGGWGRKTKNGVEVLDIGLNTLTWRWYRTNSATSETTIDAGEITSYKDGKLFLTGRNNRKYFMTVVKKGVSNDYNLADVRLHTDENNYETFNNYDWEE